MFCQSLFKSLGIWHKCKVNKKNGGIRCEIKMLHNVRGFDIIFVMKRRPLGAVIKQYTRDTRDGHSGQS
ncbi:hypothetical protein EAF28_05725 [Staphylococcus pseudintermedius]|nr:hypothetical protein [Staphylococcus pseudintermedius]